MVNKIMVGKEYQPKLFATVFGLACLLITGVFCYVLTMEVPNTITLFMAITSVFTMWMVYISAAVGLISINIQK